MRDRRSTTRFSSRAQVYAKYRPEYPAAAIDAVFAGLGDPRALLVADVGAGTGLSSRLLADRGARVLAIEPNEEMRAHAETHANVEWRAGVAEDTALTDASVDVVTAFQSYHWFDPVKALAEFTRIARRRIAVIQYEREESDELASELGVLTRRYSLDDTEALRVRTIEAFMALGGDRLRTTILNFGWSATIDQLLGYLASFSYLPHSGEEATHMQDDLRALHARYQRDGRVMCAMRVYVLAIDNAAV